MPSLFSLFVDSVLDEQHVRICKHLSGDPEAEPVLSLVGSIFFLVPFEPPHARYTYRITVTGDKLQSAVARDEPLLPGKLPATLPSPLEPPRAGVGPARPSTVHQGQRPRPAIPREAAIDADDFPPGMTLPETPFFNG